MATLEELFSALRSAHAAGKKEDAQKLADYIRSISQAAPKEEPEDERSTTEMLGAAFMRGAKQTGSLIADVLPAQIATAVGADEYAARQMEEAAQTQREIQEKYPARYPTLEAVKGPGDYLPFAGEVIAEQIPNLATAIIPGAGGAALAGRAAAGAALKRGLTAEAAAAAGASAAGKGAAGGAFLGSYALNSPEIFQNIYEETGELAPGAAALAGSVSAALDSILPAAIVNRLSPGAKSTIVERILERSGMSPGIARGAVAGVIGGVAVEGPTEAGQEAISIAAEKFVADNDAVWGSKEFNRLIESGVRGAIGGGGISGAIGAVKGVGERAPERAPEIQDPALAAAAERVRALQPEEDMGEVVDEAKPTVPPTVGAGATRTGVEPAAVEPSVPVPERGAEAVPPRAAALETGRLAEPVTPVSEPRVGEEVQPSALETEVPVEAVTPTSTPTPTLEEPAPTPAPEVAPTPTPTLGPTPTTITPQQQEIPGVSEPFSLRNLLDQSDEKQLAKYDEILEPPKKKEKVFAESTPVLKELQNTSQRLADFIASRGFDPNNLASVRRAPEDVSDAIKILGNLRAGANNIVTSIRSQEYKFATAADKEAAKAIPKTGLLNTLSRVQSDIKTARSFLDDPSSGTGQLVFSTIRQADPDVQGMKAASVQDVVEDITRGYANLPAMKAVQNVSELPADIQAQIKNEGAVPKGMYDTKTATVYFVGSNLAGPTDTVLTAIHEIIGHFGLRAILGADYQRVMNEIYNGNASIRKKADEKLRGTDKLPLEIATEEVLAEMAETKLAEYEAGKKTGISGALRRIIDAIKRFASKIGRPLKDVTDKDVLDLLSNASKFVQGERLGYDRFTEGVAADKPLEAKIDKEYRTVYSKANQELDDAMSQFQTPAGPVRIDPTNARKNIKAYAESRMRYDQAKGLFGIKKLASYGPAVRQALLKIMTLRMINDSAGTKVPQIGSAIRITENLISMRSNIMKEAQEKVINKLLDVLKRKNGSDQIQLMGEVAIQATILSVDPDPNGKFHSPNKTLSDAWDLLDDDVKEIYREMRDFYERQIDGTVNDMVERINRNVADPTKKARLIKELLDEVGPAKRKGPYFPLRRFGNYWFQVGKGDDKEFYMFESAFDRDFWMKERQAEIDASNRPDLEIVSGDQIRGATESLHSTLATESAFNQIDKIIDGSTTKGKNADQLKDELKDSIRQLNYLMLPTTNMRKMFVHRKGIPGASTDITRVFSSSAVNIAYQRARTKYADPFYQNIDNGFAALEGDTTPEARVQNDILIELENRTPHILGIEPTTGAQKLANYATQASFLWLLTAPASAILNVVGTITVGMPYIAARYGYGPAMGKMFDYLRKYVATAPTMKEGVTVAPTLEKSTDLTPLQAAAYARLSHDNAIDASLTYDVMGLADRPLEKRGLLANRFVEGISALFHHSERMNREVMTMTIFDFAYDKFKKEGKLSDAEAFESAIQEAKDLTTMSLGDFTRATRAPIFTGPVAKVLFQFKQYSLLMTYNILRNTQLGFNPFRKNLTADEKAMAVEARRRMYGVLGMTALFAGLKGMPIFSAVGAMVEAMSGDDEDEIVDFEYWLDGYLRDTFGGTAAATIMRGLIPQVTGAALSERASLDLADLWFRDSGYQKTAEDTVKEQILSLLGPTVSISLGAVKGWDTMQNGQFERGLESMMPTVARNLLVVKRYFEEEGATTKRGVMIKEDITPAEYISQALGFTPEDVMQRQKATIRRKSAESAIEAQRERLLNRLFFAVWADDDAGLDAALEKIDAYNDKYPELAINQETIQTSIANRSKSIAEQEAFGGVNKKLADRLGEQFRQPE